MTSASNYTSTFTGAPCVAVVSDDRSANRKTGDMRQVSFLRRDATPTEARKAGLDCAICGNCPMRAACYVVICQGPQSQYRALYGGNVRGQHRASAKPIRFGMYGDAGSMSRRAFLDLFEQTGAQVSGWTTYTHSWRVRPWLRPYAMASVETEAGAREAAAQGWRYFRVRPEGGELLPGEIVCPSERSEGKIKCRDCLLCCGTSRGGPNVVVTVHGSKAGNYKEQV